MVMHTHFRTKTIVLFTKNYVFNLKTFFAQIQLPLKVAKHILPQSSQKLHTFSTKLFICRHPTKNKLELLWYRIERIHRSSLILVYFQIIWWDL